MTGYLLVQAGERAVGVPIDQVEEIVPLGTLLSAPGSSAAVRGVTRVRKHMVPVVHLRALLTGGTPDDACADTAVLVSVGEARVALEVDTVHDLVRDPPMDVPAGWDVPWAQAVAQREGSLLPIVDLDVLIDRLRPVPSKEESA